MRLFALRGAATVDRNEPDAILTATQALMQEIMDRNDLGPDDVVSCIFTLTDDLDAEFPLANAQEGTARGIIFDGLQPLLPRVLQMPVSFLMAILVVIRTYPLKALRSEPIDHCKCRHLHGDLEAVRSPPCRHNRAM